MKRSRDIDIDVDDVIASMSLNRGLLAAFKELTEDELAALLGELANRARLPTSAFKRARLDLTSFSQAKWSNFARQHGLRELTSTLSLGTFTTPRYRLPPSLHESMLQNVWRWQDVYRESMFQERESGKVRLLEPYLVPLMALFQGRVFDKPEQAMVRTLYSTGGEVEHEIFMIGGVLFLVVEDKRNTPDDNSLARLFLELLSAAEMNKKIDFAGLRIYGLLTNLQQYKFYSYDPSTKIFFFDELVIIMNKRVPGSNDMIDVVNKIFGLVLTGYIDGLRAIKERSEDRAKRNALSPESSAPGTGPSSQESCTSEESEGGGRKSTTQWETALRLATICVEKFQEPVTSFEEVEERGNRGLEWLTKSVCSIPRASPFTGDDDDPSTPAELKTLAAKIVREENERYLAKLR